jgi:hypothetical protein
MPSQDDPERRKGDEEFDKFWASLWNNPIESSGTPAPSARLNELGVTSLAHQLGLADTQTNGHWCSRCQGIWYGYTLEVECPICGNRQG